MNQEFSEALDYIHLETERFTKNWVKDTYHYSNKYITELIEFGINQNIISSFFHFDCTNCGEAGLGNSGKVQGLNEKAECEECGSVYTKIEDHLYEYYKFNEKSKTQEKKRSEKAPLEDRIIDYEIPTSINKHLDQEVSNFLKAEKNPLIWHISDMHFGKKGIWNPGHSESLYRTIVDSYFQHRQKGKDFIFVTGDLTTNGSAKSVKIASQFLDVCKNIFNKVFVVPGNHDLWNGSRKRLFLGKIFKFFGIKRKGPFKIDTLLSRDLVEKKFSIEVIDWAEFKVAIISIDSTFRDSFSLSQGIFPDKKETPEIAAELRKLDFDFSIIILHHHIITYEQDSSGHLKFIKDELAMRMINAHNAKKFIRQNDIRLILHGHRHVQFKEVMLTKISQAVFCPAPALFLDGADPDDESVGFNLLKAQGKYLYLIQVKLDGEYKVDAITRVRPKSV